MTFRNFHKPGRSIIYSINGIVSTSHPLATLESINILQKGGNAIDSAIAANAVLSVVEPQSTGIGGDCFALISLKNNENIISVNGSGHSPNYTDLNFFNNNNKIDKTIDSPHFVTIPGAVHAWRKLWEKYGRISWDKLFEKAIFYAENGFNIYERVAYDWEQERERLMKYKNTRDLFLKNGSPYFQGEIFKNKKLGKTLEIISKEGSDPFYNGIIAKDIVETLQKIGGKHKISDFEEHKTDFVEPIEVKYKNISLFQCPPNNHGLTAAIIMKILEDFDLKKYEPMSFERYHLEAEACKLAYYIRDNYISDPLYNSIDYKKLINNQSISILKSKISLGKILSIEKKLYTDLISSDTVYNSFIDSERNIVSFINSIFHPFGSTITTENTGILLQNRGAGFNFIKGHPNCIDKQKKPLHTIMPGLIRKNGKTILSYGVMGGQYQPTGHVQFLNNYFEFNMNIQESLNFPRAFWYGGELQIEEGVSKEVEEKLNKVGHNVIRIKNPLGGGQAIGINWNDGSLFAGSDCRKDGCAIGY